MRTLVIIVTVTVLLGGAATTLHSMIVSGRSPTRVSRGRAGAARDSSNQGTGHEHSDREDAARYSKDQGVDEEDSDHEVAPRHNSIDQAVGEVEQAAHELQRHRLRKLHLQGKMRATTLSGRAWDAR
jgi:hypothetical protein